MAGTMPLQQRPVALLDVGARAAFLQKVYAHLLLAVGAFVGIETLLFTTGMAERLFDWFSSGGAWLVMLGGFMVVNWLATMAARIAPKSTSLNLASRIMTGAQPRAEICSPSSPARWRSSSLWSAFLAY